MAPISSALPFSPAELSYLHTSLCSIPPIRPDSRSATDFRPFSAETGVLPATNGSAHVSFSDGSEAIVGVKLEVEKTGSTLRDEAGFVEVERHGDDEMDIDDKTVSSCGRAEWISLTLTLPGLRDDDSSLVFLEEMLREALISSETNPNTSMTPMTMSLQDKLIINSKWHWHMYIDVLLISAQTSSSYPLPLLSMATHLALRDTRVPRLKSQGEEDPIADDDWMASVFLYPKQGKLRPPVTLLVMVAGDSILFDPSREELSVADGVIATSIGGSMEEGGMKILAMRMIDTPARDTMKGVPMSNDIREDSAIAGVWRPRVGGIKRNVVKQIVKAALGSGVAKDVMLGLDEFLVAERHAASDVAYA